MSTHPHQPSPPASPGYGVRLQPNPSQSSAYEANSMRSPGYPSPPASPPQIVHDDSAARKVLGSGVSVSRSPSTSSPTGYAPHTASGYTSIASAAAAMHQPSNVMMPPTSSSAANAPKHPPSKLATGGQSHSHRPVSAMPTPTEHATSASRAAASPAGGASDVFASMNANYADRRASAHPTMTSSHNGPSASGPAPIDPTTSQAISSGIPITSPAALSYFAAHPRRQQVHFGNYLLLQTLGEGEFGKVKLGVHKEWGEEVAVKLIKRDKVGSDAPLNLDDDANKDPAKMSKVEREIQVLKDVRHPNIVRLYEVIESDRYIGIVLEYASGGELFDHILAHKYLKEEHACRLFAQLISGVSYLHQKKIVHRDLKLENLLLDRNRNVIITDFGFANNFEDKRDDLMATSCGSPCYAAPELVVQDGLYAGSAVDVWSCGVILYAMLAGYLPFDDDPANPDGDNINLLYKYILATPLSFPEYVTAQPRDLLSRMLVPDPTKRATLEQVMQHSWLRNYRELFKFSVEDLERAAMEQQTKKRQMYRQQMVYQHQLQEQQRRNHMERSQSVRQNASHLPVGTAYTTNTAVPASSTTHRQTLPVSATVPDRLIEPVGSASRGVEPGMAASHINVAPTLAPAPLEPIGAPLPRAFTHANVAAIGGAVDPVTALGNARGEPRTRLDDGTTTPVTSAAAREAEQRKPAAQKVQHHTIQLEYGTDERSRNESAASARVATPPGSRQASASHRKVSADSPQSRIAESERAKAAADKLAAAAASTPSVLQPAPAKTIPAVPALIPESEKLIVNKVESQSRIGAPEMIRSASASSASRISVPSPILEQNQSTSHSNRGQSSDPNDRKRVSSSTGASSRANIDGHDPRVPASSGQRVISNPLPAGEAVGFPSSSGDRVASAEGAVIRSSAARQGSIASESRSPSATRPVTADKAAASATRHRKGMSTDKFFLSRLLGSNAANGAGSSALSSSNNEAQASEKSKRNSVGRAALDRAPSSGGSKNSRRKAMSLVVGRPAGDTSAAADRARALEANAQLHSATDTSFTHPSQSRRKDNESISSQQRKQRKESTQLAGPGSTISTTTSRPSTSRPSTSRPSTSRPSNRQQPLQQFLQQDKTFYDGSTIASNSMTGPSSNAAKKVMDWFRKKSLSRGAFNEQPPLGPFERSPTNSQISTTRDAPSVIVTDVGPNRHAEANTGSNGETVASSVPSSRSTSGTHSENSEVPTEMTQFTTMSASDAGESEGVKSSASTVQQQATPKASLSAVSNESTSSAGKAAQSSSQPPHTRELTAAPSPTTTTTTTNEPFNETRLRYHLGAVDQSALTSRSPIDVLKEVRRVLYEMGIDVRTEKDEDFKLECIRRKRAKTLMSATQGIGMSIRSSVFPPTQADVERSSRMSHRDSLNPSGSTAGGASLRSFLRRGSYQAGATSPKMGSVGLPSSASTVGSGMVIQDENQPAPLYGDASVDGGQEIRFSVEVTRIKNLAGLYSLDIRRMKGNLWAYKFVYQALLDRCQLAA
ncbi:related to Serine/threonine protein kinase [Melanopsichium pennsylvanicum]|uniref:non-specific serine/threonine protein kinase n=2 Tax=Melanopsichium pennsylvanicum TaxID=63383 RepID=A0AAJ4XPJ7_9BASI|nr:related to Serine/threonine protein kinase [Melanopsichium pennsylvanicum 4]SNX86435.1 related to Serine/threonine protein kinase [Melanopsichium pennsylvanicum]